MSEAVCLSVDQALDCIKLIHNNMVIILIFIINGSNIRISNVVLQWIVASLGEFEIHKATANLEEVFDDVFLLAGVIS